MVREDIVRKELTREGEREKERKNKIRNKSLRAERCCHCSEVLAWVSPGGQPRETRDGERRREFSGACGFCAKFEVGECFEVGQGRLRGAHKAAGAAAAVPRSATARRCPEEPPRCAAALSLPAEPSDKVIQKTLKSISHPNL